MNKLVILVVLACSLASCNYIGVYEKNTAIDNGKWKSSNALAFDYEAEDTTSIYNIFINIRHTGTYQYSNIYLFVSTQAPNGQILKDTVEFVLANNSGKWIGSGIGDMHDLRLAYKRNVKFGQSGKYQFKIEQAMRDVTLQSVTDAGIRIEKAK